MPRSGPRTVRRYSDVFKLAAVRLSQEPGIQVQTVAAALAIHRFMLSKWRKDARDGRLRGGSAASTRSTRIGCGPPGSSARIRCGSATSRTSVSSHAGAISRW
jgi:transposase-like protein